MDQRLVDQLLFGVAKIDDSCKSLLNGKEQGLVHVKNEYYDQAMVMLGKKLTEETIIAWKLAEHLQAQGFNVLCECRYPNQPTKLKCDIVVKLDTGHETWIEVKLAWKAWFNCQDGPVYSNSCYKPYLFGISKTHSFKHDLEKLGNASLPAMTDKLVCLIGFDHFSNPMEAEVRSVVDEQERNGNIWYLSGEKHWVDKRNHNFVFHTWCWG